MNDPHDPREAGDPADREDTERIPRASTPEPTRPLWPSPSPPFPAGQQGPAPTAYPDPRPEQPLVAPWLQQAPGPGPRKPPPGRVPLWLWPAVAVFSLLVGLGGGVLGGFVYDVVDSELATGSSDPAVLEDTVSEAPLPTDNDSIAAVAQKLLPSTVQVVAQFQGQRAGATGSGFVLDTRGHLVTNNHVVAEAAAQDGPIGVVDQDGNHYRAELVGRSPVYDLAVLHVEGAHGLRPAALGASEPLRIGDAVVAIGSPLGLSSTVTAGIVSAKDRPVTTGDSGDQASYINAVQTDAAINPGNSGGPLVNLAGQVVGVNSAIATAGSFGGEAGNIGVGFAIPIEQVRVTAAQILRDGEARYPVIGATVDTGGRADRGARITEVGGGTPAETAGLRADDVVTAVDGQRVDDGIALIVAIRTHQPGETIALTIRRDGREQDVDVTLDGKVG